MVKSGVAVKNNALRKSGIEVIGDVEWGTHLCQFYKTKEDLIDILVPYFKAGLKNNEFCMWVTSEPLTAKDARAALKKGVKNLDEYIKKGQIEIIDHNQWYTKSGRFESDSVLKGLDEKEAHALKKGFDGLRLTGNIFWLEKGDWKKFADYEKMINTVIDKHKMIAICSYSLDQCGAIEILDVISNHEAALIRQKGRWGLIESSEIKEIKKTLKLSEHRFSDLVENVADWVWEVDKNGVYIYSSSRVKDLIGYDASEVLGKTPFDFMPKEEVKKISNIFKKAVAELKPLINIENVIRHKDGHLVVLETCGVPIFDGEGQFKGYSGIDRDITERKRAEEALKKSEEKYRNIVELLPDGIVTADMNGFVTSINASFMKMIGFSKNEIIGKHFTELPTLQKIEISKLMKIFSSVLGGNIPEPFEFTWVDKKGSPHIAEGYTTIIKSNNKAQEIHAVIRDITERKKTEEDMKNLAKFPEENSNPIYRVSKDGILLYANPASRRLILEDQTKIGDKIPKKWIEMIKNVYASGKRQQSEIEFSGRVFLFELIPMIENGYVDSYAIDITERKKTEEQLRENEDRLRIILGAVQTGLVIIDVETHRIVDANPTAAKLIGAPKEQIIGSVCHNYICPAEKGRCPITDLGQTVDNSERILLTAGGRKCSVMKTAVPVVLGGRKHLLESFIDITELKKTEDMLRINESKYRQLFDENNDTIFIADPQTRMLIDCNKKAEQLSGYSRQEILSMRADQLHPEDKVEETMKGFKDQASGLIENIETEVLTKNGRRVPVLINSSAIDISGTPCLLGVFRDITERKKMEEMLKIKDVAIALSINGIAISDLAGNLSYVNNSFLKLWGYDSEQEVIGKSSLIFWNDPEQAKVVTDALLQDGRWFGELAGKKKDGSIIFVQLSGNIILDPSSKAIGMMAAFIDITERKKTEQTLQESDARLRNIFDGVNDALIYLDSSGTIIDINKKAVQIFGGTPKELVGRDFTEIGIFSPEELPLLMDNFTKILAGEMPFVTMHLKNKSGITVWLEASSSILSSGNKVLGVMIVARDITERKQAEEIISESRAKYKKIFDNVRDEIIYIDTTGTIIDVNPVVKEIFGWSPEEIIGKNFTELGFFNAEDIREYNALFQNIFATGKATSLIEVKMKAKNGKNVFVEVNTSFIEKNGKIENILVIARDITERKKTEDEIKRSRDDLEKAYEELKTLDTMKAGFMNVAAHELKTPLIPVIGYLDMLMKNEIGIIDEKQTEILKIIMKNIKRLQRLIQDVLDITKLESGVMKFDMNNIQLTTIIKDAVKNVEPIAKERSLVLTTKIPTRLPLIYGDSYRLAQVMGDLLDNAIKFTEMGCVTVEAKRIGNEIMISVKDTGIGFDKAFMPNLFKKFMQADTTARRRYGGTGLGLAICKEIVEKHGGRIWAESTPEKGSVFNFTLPVKLGKGGE
ncbi:MAG: PAS domain S-box protein [Candidatus Aenigmarchaeota archaeon]|nr:PAS domain S-box protein [Candidatus Aenigmarchaeota archaeon]